MSGQQQIDLSKQVAINLPLGAWNTVLNLIAKGPWDVADPLMQVIRAQIQAATQPPQARQSPRAVLMPQTPSMVSPSDGLIPDKEAG